MAPAHFIKNKRGFNGEFQVIKLYAGKFDKPVFRSRFFSFGKFRLHGGSDLAGITVHMKPCRFDEGGGLVCQKFHLVPVGAPVNVVTVESAVKDGVHFFHVRSRLAESGTAVAFHQLCGVGFRIFKEFSPKVICPAFQTEKLSETAAVKTGNIVVAQQFGLFSQGIAAQFGHESFKLVILPVVEIG